MSAAKNEIDDFLNGALVSWVESCLPNPEILCGYSSLLDGSILYSICVQIDPEPQHSLVKFNDLDGIALMNARAKNFDAIVRNLKSLYEDELGQTLLELPDCNTLGYSPESKSGLEQMKILLTLLLGAAVQCPNKEIFIARIKELDIDTQHAIVEFIKQVTDNQTLVLTQDSLDHLAPNKMYNHIIRLAKERDMYHSNWISSLANDLVNGSISKLTPSHSTSSASSSDSNHLAVELADLKSKLRKLRQELEEKSETYLEIKEDLDHKCNQFEKLRTESQAWYVEAKRAAAYRDEVDVLRERADRADRLEVELQRFREKLSDAEFYKTRVDELREDNRLLLETKEMLEEQLQRSRRRSEHTMSLESEIIKYKQRLNDLSLERDSDKSKLQELLDENTQLQIATKHLTSLNSEIESLKPNFEDKSGDNSLSEQLTNNAQTRALKLELENRRLVSTLESLKESSFHESSNKILDLEKEKKKLSLKCDQLQENGNRLVQQNEELQTVFKNALEEVEKLQETINSNKQVIDKQNQDRELEKLKIIDLENHVEMLNKDKNRIQTHCDHLQKRSQDLERNVDSKGKEIEQLHSKTIELDTVKREIYDLKSKFTNAEKENTNLIKEVTKLRETIETKDVILDENAAQLDQKIKEIARMNRVIVDYKVMNTKQVELEQKNQELEMQNQINSETISTLQNDLVSATLATNRVKEDLEKMGFVYNENIDLNVESIVKKFVENPETFKTVREIMLNCGKEIASTDICILCHRKEIYTVEKEFEISPRHIEAMPKSVTNIDFVINTSEADAVLQEKNDQLVSENVELKTKNELLVSENANQNVELSKLSSQINSLNTQHVALQLANTQLATEKDTLVKKLDAIKTQHDSLLQDQVSLQCLHEQLNSEYDNINKEKEILKISLRDVRLDNRNLKEMNANLEKTIEELRLEITSMKELTINLTNLRGEHSKLKDDFRSLFTTNDRLKEEYKNIHDMYRTLRTENSRLKLQNTELSGELGNRAEQLLALEIELTKQTQKCETLVQMTSNLDSDRRTLMEHASQVLTQYHELLAHSLEDKQHFHQEEKQLTDKVNNLNRHKEKLEEKIMEHYRKLDSCSPKKKTFGSEVLKRVRKAGSEVISRFPTRNRKSWIEDSQQSQAQPTTPTLESIGNDSDNSTEEPSSLSDTAVLQKYYKLRQSLPRNTINQHKNAKLESTTASPFIRGSISRTSLQIPSTKSTHNSLNSTQSLDPSAEVPTLSLGSAGSRRTVYLVDEIPKINENTSKSATTGNSVSGGGNHKSDDSCTDQNDSKSSTIPTTTTPAPSTVLMYNRISTMIGNDAVGNYTEYEHENGGPITTSTPSKDDNRKKNNIKSKESAVWYEYGCV